MREDALLDTAARTIFRTWWCKGGIANPYGCSKERQWLTAHMPSTIESSGFLKYWETAQRTGSVSDWQKVQLKDIWVNDLSDGNGYVLEPYTLWPMYEGQTPPGVRAFNEVTFVFVRTSQVVNITRVTLNQKYIELNYAFGVNILDNNLIIYLGAETDLLYEYPWKSNLASVMRQACGWLTLSSGSEEWQEVGGWIWSDWYVDSKVKYGTKVIEVGGE
jgi:hypothetical protein